MTGQATRTRYRRKTAVEKEGALNPIRWTVLACLTIAITLGATSVTGNESSSLRDLAVAAISEDESIGRAASGVRRAEADRRLARSALLPRLDLNGTWTRFQEEQSVEFAPGESFEIRPLQDWNWSADLQQTLFYGLRDWRAKDLARLNLDIARLEQRVAIDDLLLEVATSFFTAVATEQQVEVRRAALEQIRSRRTVAERRFEVGETAIADVSRWRAEFAAETQRLVVAEGDAELSRRRLQRLTGVRDVGRLVIPGPVPIPIGDDADLVYQALNDRLEMASLSNQLEAAGLFVKIEKGAWLPEVDLNLQYYQQKAEFPSSDWASVGVTARVPVYDGGVTASRVAKAKEDVAEIQLLTSEVAKVIADQVESAAIAFRAASAAFDAADERRNSAREANRQIEAAYRVGEASATDLLEVTTSLTDAETAYIIARNQRQLQAIALRRAVGDQPLPGLDPASLPEPIEE